MGQVDESGKETASVVAEPVTPAAEIPSPSISPSIADAKPEKIPTSFRDSLAAMAAPLAAPFAARPRLSRVTVLTIAIALSAAAGSAVGAMAAATFAKPQPISSDTARTIEVNSLRGVITQLSAEVASLKASVDNNAKTANARMARIADQVERTEKAQAEPASRVAKLSELLERIDRRTASASTPAQALAAAAAPETTGSIAPKQQDRPPVVAGWIVREVFDGRAMVEHERFGFFEVVPGANLPGIGKVETIRRQDGRWVVVTPKGLILSAR